MTAFGNAPAIDLTKGRASCVANIRRDCEKLLILVHEMQGDDSERETALKALDLIGDLMRLVERFGEKR